MGKSAPENRKKFFTKFGIPANLVVDMQVEHGDKILRVDKKDCGKLFDGYDGLITNEKGLYLGLLVADCIPVAIYDSVNEAVGLIHIGWRNLAGQTIEKVYKMLRESFGTNPKDTTIYLAPHVCAMHYEVKDDVVLIFKNYSGSITKIKGNSYLNLEKVLETKLKKLGVKPKNIRIDGRCTFEDKTLFSYRRGDKTERNLYLLTLG